ncbi:hypothetical protein [Frankia sp. QA3]|uniref:hypothetical protein n=1 Tax=Frankia sp. QA3 TaxID=710111 RepID=UPI0012F9B6F1|nr:hypothetical protein [Frankia sp. QA3]
MADSVRLARSRRRRQAGQRRSEMVGSSLKGVIYVPLQVIGVNGRTQMITAGPKTQVAAVVLPTMVSS